MPKLIITGSFRFPDKDAAGLRVQGLGEVFRDLGYIVSFAGWQGPVDLSGRLFHRGFKFFSLDELDKNNKSLFKRFINFIQLGSNTLKWLKTQKLSKGDLVIIYNSQSLFILKVLIYSKLVGFKLILDCTEWYDGSHLPGGKFGPANIDNLLRIYLVNPLVKNLIVISYYLQKFYLTNYNIASLVIPPLFKRDCFILKDKEWFCDHNDIKYLIYVGSPGKKDIFRNFLIALSNLSDKGIVFKVTIVGPNKEAFISDYIGDFKSDFLNSFYFPGRVPHSEVHKYYNNSHFSILFRDNIRSNNAGFSSKFVESCFHGVPVLCNNTSDILTYSSVPNSSYILNDTSVSSIQSSLDKINSLDYNQHIELFKNSLEIANASFEYSRYLNKFSKFIRDL